LNRPHVGDSASELVAFGQCKGMHHSYRNSFPAQE
jgi:hypothetical protein